MPNQSPYELISNPDKTTLTCPGGVVLSYGPGPGLRHSIFWNRIGSLFSCYRPAVAVLDVFDAQAPQTPLLLKTDHTWWEPNLCTAAYAAEGLRIEEQRTALKAGVKLQLRLTNSRSQAREYVLFFHGAVEQWAFFDYQRGQPEPLIECSIEPGESCITLTQPHPHDGLPEPVNSIQRVEASEPFAACGFLQNVSELSTLWREHGCLANMRLRLGQVGGRYASADRESLTFSHAHPVYYFALKVRLEPGETREVEVQSRWHTDDEGGELADAQSGTTREEWEHYLSEEVPQLECDDEALTRYWYYVWYVLRANRTAPGKHVKHAYTAPSKYMYWGPWIWDTYFHVLGEMWLKDPEVARNSIRAVLDMQFPNGFLPVCSGSQYRMCFHDSVPGYESPTGGGYASYVDHNIRDYKECEHPYEAEFEHRVGDGWQHMLHNEKTQTPLITPAAMKFYHLRIDEGFRAEVHGALLRYENWQQQRRTDSEGRFTLWHGDESGWDNATRHYPVPALPFDVQVHRVMHLDALIALRGYDQEDAELALTLWQRHELAAKALESYWDENDKWYYDLAAEFGEVQEATRRKQIAPSGAFGLLVPYAHDRQHLSDHAAWVGELLENPKVFGTEYPIPTLAVCDSDYAPHGWGWNGPAWLQVNYFAIVGLLTAQQHEAAFRLWEKTKQLIIKDGQPHSFELYDPELGTGMGCPDYSWQAMINHLIIRHFAGLHHWNVVLSPALPPGINLLNISNLPGFAASISLKRDGSRLVIEVSYREEQVCALNTQGLGQAGCVTANGHPLLKAEGQPGVWIAQEDLQPAKNWRYEIELAAEEDAP